MKRQFLVALSVLAAAGTPALAQDALPAETLTVQERIPAGPHVYVMDMGINGSSPIYVLNADDLSLVGSIGTGTLATMHMSADKSTLYSSSVYLRRYTYGEVEAVIHEWDPETLKAKKEFMVSPKLVQALSQRGILNVSSDGKFILAQNATPATSVTIADAVEGKDLGEVPTPGCWTAYPSETGNAFTMLCGDGTLAKFTYDATGKTAAPAKSDKIFDPDKDPLYGDAMRIDGKLVYVTYGGTLYVIDDSGDKPVLDKQVKFAEEGWAPSGYNLMAYSKPAHTLFVLMHSNPRDGSHKAPAEEIWAIDTATMKVVGRSPAHGEASIEVSSGDQPVLFGVGHEGSVHRYDVKSDGGKVTLTETASREGAALFPTILATDF
ncbi:amine dehydrogenase large subunit [Amaricoccus solimangrovi]|uniref:Amine dehydrogenase n=1 Tax=Amaricoccus solimangrovi TaxID=2589815 RepID=A0A501WV29_9RHOB|nr:amine dehydrogenase large subunit [Amaricoccus solimangrovi]TPE53268.1 hypothetical protein FJM51_04420 [Amaricoccus solimangrovi]